MSKKLHVGNLGPTTGDSDLNQLFAAHGAVQSAKVITDRLSGASKGFGFVEMSNDGEAQAAMTALNGQECGGQAITVAEARPRPEGAGNRR